MKFRNRRKNERDYNPRNFEKYVGNYPIVTRSSWEYKFCEWLDSNPKVTEWSSESHIIRYVDPISKKNRRYYPDFYAKIGKNRYIIEIKPRKDLRLPRKGKKSDKTIITQTKTFQINEAKFEAAKRYCKKMRYHFVVLTEKELFREKK